jgi:isocitrate dehydrogenase
MFEAIHGTAPDIGGKNIANPSGLLQGAVMMLHHIGQSEVAQKIQNAWLVTLEKGIHTADIFQEGVSKQRVGTKEFADAVIENLGSKPAVLTPVIEGTNSALKLPKYVRKPSAKKELVGVDIFVHWSGTDPNELAAKIQPIAPDGVELSMITNRGIKVWPDGFKETFCTDHWRCRFKPTSDNTLNQTALIDLLQQALSQGIDTIKTENLYAFDGVPKFSLGQGQ